MAPILSTNIGIFRQIIDDERLRQLREKIEGLKLKAPLVSAYKSAEEIVAPLDIEQLVSLVEPFGSWPFEEQVRKIEQIFGAVEQ